MRRPLLIAGRLLLILASSWSIAAAGHTAGDTAQGATLDDAGLGKVNFPTSTHSQQAQQEFLRGMLLLHLFEYPAAEGAFISARTIDPTFAMAYWGEAMTFTHPLWNEQDKARGAAALARLGPTDAERAAKAGTPLERDWLAVADTLYGAGDKVERDRRVLARLEEMNARYPRNHEVELFLSLWLMGVTQGERNVPNYLRAAEIAREVYGRNPAHPGATHYWIHGMDSPEHASGALEAARVLARISPAAGHAQHMTSHIFIALGMWDDLVAANERAMAVVNAGRVKRGQPATYCGHYAEWLIYGYYQQGRERDGDALLAACNDSRAAAVAWADNHYDPKLGSSRSGAQVSDHLARSLATMRATAVIESPAVRAQALAITIDTQAMHRSAGWVWFPEGYAATERGDFTAADSAALRILGLALQPREAEEAASGDAYVEIMAQTLAGLTVFRRGDKEGGLDIVERAATRYESVPFDFGPPVPVKPPQELAGEMLLGLGRAAEARAYFERALNLAPRRAQSLRGLARAAAAAGDDAAARAAYTELVAIWHSADAGSAGKAEAASWLSSHGAGH
jgi:tetratricopeptide (TPR) repeat protein